MQKIKRKDERMIHSYKKLVSILLAIFLLIVIIVFSPEYRLVGWVIPLLSGIAISLAFVPFPSDKGKSVKTSKPYYLILPAAYTLGFMYISGLIAVNFFVIGFCLAQIYKTVKIKFNNKVT